MEENREFDEIKFLKENNQSPKQWAEDTIRAHSYHGDIPKEYLERLKECKTWADVLILLKEVVPFLKR